MLEWTNCFASSNSKAFFTWVYFALLTSYWQWISFFLPLSFWVYFFLPFFPWFCSIFGVCLPEVSVCSFRIRSSKQLLFFLIRKHQWMLFLFKNGPQCWPLQVLWNVLKFSWENHSNWEANVYFWQLNPSHSFESLMLPFHGLNSILSDACHRTRF